ncbi:MAG: PPC domain-containing protein [Spirochaetaceae bacterium]|jgi:hypothetical protein|nr:PPC domain-containing protein [Spirochaetaceae bacterium]
MLKRLLPFFVFFFALSLLYGQNSASPLPQLDGAVKSLAADLGRRIAAQGGAPKINVGSWAHEDSIPALSSFWAAQLAEELANIPGRSFVLLPGGSGAADWTISGEIVEIAGTVRIYTRLIRSGDRSITVSLHSDFVYDEYFSEMLAHQGGGRSSPSVARDSYEPDSPENPLAAEIADSDGGPLINRTLHGRSDEDFFLLTPDREGVLTMETTGSIDTLMEFYEAGSRETLAENDDGGSGGNARIRYTVRAGGRYIAKVRGYDSDDTGNYGFRAWLVEQVRQAPDEYENDDDFLSAKDISIGTPQQHSFTTGDDVDWVTFRVSQAGRYTIRARGLSSNGLDTYIELYDSDRSAIDEDDDGGENLDSRLSVSLQAGTYYVKAECLDDEPDQPYTISVERED